MSALRLLTASDCHLCGHAQAVLEDLELEWSEVPAESDEGRRLGAIAPPMRPVLFAEGDRVLAYGRLSAKRLRRQLERGALVT